MMAATFFDDSESLRAWLAANHATATELVIGFHKKGSGRAGLSYAEVVDQALCFGWIDGVMRPIDGHSYGLRFTPRKAGSIWSKVNIAKVEVLLERGLMERAGLAAFERRTAAKTGVYSFEQESPELDPASVEIFKGNADAWASWERLPPSYRHAASWWVVSAKRPETRASRLARLIEVSAAGERLPHLSKYSVPREPRGER